MASPQKEDGFTPIANEIMDALMRTRILVYDRMVLDCIIRKTYGWNKKADSISLSQFQEATGIARQNVCRSLRSLSRRNLIIVNKDNRITTYQFQKDYTLWDNLLSHQIVSHEITLSPDSLSRDNEVVSHEITTIISPDNKVVSHETHTKDIKDTITKDIIQKKGGDTLTEISETFGKTERVKLTNNELLELTKEFDGNATNDNNPCPNVELYIEKLDAQIGKNPQKAEQLYKSHYHTLRKWMIDDKIKPETSNIIYKGEGAKTRDYTKGRYSHMVQK